MKVEDNQQRPLEQWHAELRDNLGGTSFYADRGQPRPHVETSFLDEQRQDSYDQQPEDEFMDNPPRIVSTPMSQAARTPRSQVSGASPSSMNTVVAGQAPSPQRSCIPRSTTPGSTKAQTFHSDLPSLTPIYQVGPQQHPNASVTHGFSFATPRANDREQMKEESRDGPPESIDDNRCPTPRFKDRQLTPHSRAERRQFFTSTPNHTRALSYGGSSVKSSSLRPDTKIPSASTSLVVREATDLVELGGKVDTLNTNDPQNSSQRAVLNQSVREQGQLMAETQILHGNLGGILEKNRQTSEERMDRMEAVLQDKLMKFEESQNQALERERMERSQFITQLEDKLDRRQLEINDLKNQLKEQEINLSSAQQDRESLQKEIKNILVTLHFQFEHLTDQAAKHDERVKGLEEKHQAASKGIDQNIEEVTTYVDSIQYEISQVQLENKALWRQCEDEHKAALDDVKKKLTKSLDDAQEELRDELSEQRSKVTVVAEALQAKSSNLGDLIQKVQDETEIRFSEADQNFQSFKEDVTSSYSKQIQEVEASILQTVDGYQQNTDSKQASVERGIQSQGEAAETMMKTIDSIATKYDDMLKMTVQSKSDWETKFDSFKDEVAGDHSALSETLSEKLGALRKKISDAHEMWQGKFATLSADFVYQRAANTDLKTKQEQQNDSTNELKSNLRSALEHVNVLTERLGDIHDNQENVSRSIGESKHDYYSLFEKTEKKIQALQGALTQMSEELQDKTEGDMRCVRQEFSSKHSVLEAKLISFEEQREATVRSLQNYESELHDTAASIDKMMDPWISKQTAMDCKLENHSALLQSLKAEVVSKFVDRQDLQDSTEALRRELESDFGRECTENFLTEMQNQMNQYQMKLEEVTLEHENTKTEVESVRTEHQMSLEHVGSQLLAWDDQVKGLFSFVKEQEVSHNATKLELLSSKESVERRLSDHLTMLTEWKNRIEESLDKREQKVSRQLKAQQYAADKQAARIVLKAAKTERESCQRELEEKMHVMNEKFEAYLNQTRHDIAEVNQTIRDVQIGDQDSSLTFADMEKKVAELNTNDGIAMGETKQQILKLQTAVESMKSTTTEKEKVLLELERRMDIWNTKFNEVVGQIQDGIARQIQGQATNESNKELVKADLDKNMRELSAMEKKLKMTTQQLNDTRYECRGLRRQLSSNKEKQMRGQNGSEVKVHSKFTYSDLPPSS